MNMFRRSVAALALVLALMPWAAQAQKLAVAGHTPKSAVAVLSVNDAKAIWGNLSQSPLKAPLDKLMNSPAVLNSDGFTKFMADRADAEKEMGFALTADSVFNDVLRGFDFYALKGAPGADGKPGKASAAVAASFAKDEQAKAVLARIMKKATEKPAAEAGAAPDAAAPVAPEMKTMKVGDKDVMSVPSANIYGAAVGTNLFLATSEQAITELLTATPDAPLMASADFKETYEGIKAINGQVWLYVDGTEAAKLGDEAEGLSALAAAKDTAFAGAGEFSPDRIKFTSFVPASKMGSLLKAEMANAPKGQSGAIRFLPDASMLAYSANGLNLKAILDAMTADGAAGNEKMQQATQGMQMMMMMVGGQLGMSIENDVLPAIGNEFAGSLIDITFNPMTQQGGGDLVLVIKAADPAKIAALMTKIEGMLADNLKAQFTEGGMATPADLKIFTTEDYKGTALHVFTPPPGVLQFPISPTYSITADGYLLIALTKDGMTRSLDRATATTGTMTSSANLAKAAKLSTPNPMQVYLVDVARVTDYVSGLFMMMKGASMEQSEREAAASVFELLKACNTLYVSKSATAAGQRDEMIIMMK